MDPALSLPPALKTAISKASKSKRLDLSYMDLSEIPASVLKLKNLEELNLSHNSISSVPDTIAQLQNLKQLGILNFSLALTHLIFRHIYSCDPE